MISAECTHVLSADCTYELGAGAVPPSEPRAGGAEARRRRERGRQIRAPPRQPELTKHTNGRAYDAQEMDAWYCYQTRLSDRALVELQG